MSDMGALEHFLDVRVTRTGSYNQFDQFVYSQKVSDTFVYISVQGLRLGSAH